MKPLAIPETLSICTVCNNELAMEGKQECCECLLDRRFAAWALADGEEIPHFDKPRITEVPLPHSRRSQDVAWRVMPWVGVLVLWAFVIGWCVGRFA